MRQENKQINRKREIRNKFFNEGEAAAKALNDSYANGGHPKGPLSDVSIRTLFSDWRNKRDLGKAPASAMNKAMRASAAKLLEEKLGGPVTRIPGPAEQYQLPDGTTATFRSNRARALMGKMQLFNQGSDWIVSIIPRVAGHPEKGIDVYKSMSAKVRKTFKDNNDHWETTHPSTTNDLCVLSFDKENPAGGSIEDIGRDFATKWKGDFMGSADLEPTLTLVPTPAPKPADEPVMRYADNRRFKVVHDQEILNAPDMEGIVTLLRTGVRFSEPEKTNADFMRTAAARAATLSGAKARTDSAEHFVWDLHAAGLIEIIKREIVLEEVAGGVEGVMTKQHGSTTEKDMKYETHTDPRDIKPDTTKAHLRDVWWASDDEMDVYEANEKCEHGTVKKETVAGWLRYWRWWKQTNPGVSPLRREHYV